MDRPKVPLNDVKDPAATPADAAVRALLAVSRLLAATAEGSAEEIHEAVVREARTSFGAGGALLLVQEPGRRLRVLAGDRPEGLDRHPVSLDDLPTLADVLDRRVRLLRLDDAAARQLEPVTGSHGTGVEVLLLLLRIADGRDGVLVLSEPTRLDIAEVATAFADAAASALGRLRAQLEHERRSAQQVALTHAARTLNGSLDLDTVLTRICDQAATVLDSTVAVVHRRSADGALTLAAARGLPPEAVGYRLPPGTGLSGKVLAQGRAMLTNDYGRIAELPSDAPYPKLAGAMAAPIEWDGELRGVLAVGYEDPRGVTHRDLSVLEALAELAATACANASAHAGLATVARTDGLTGCLNHAALHDSLRREIERATRAGGACLSLVLVDLDDFKQVNEVHGHLAGDEVLRRAGHALRQATRPYDLAARYGGDEFALIAVDADEPAACDIGLRALARIDAAIREFLPPGGSPGTAGVAQWSAGLTVTELVARADRALLYAKHEGARGQVLPFSGVADRFRPGRFSRSTRDAALPSPPALERNWPGERLDERLRRRAGALALANALGARLAAMVDSREVVAAAEQALQDSFGYSSAAVVPAGAVEAGEDGDGLMARCVATRRPVVAAGATNPAGGPDGGKLRSGLAVPVRVGEGYWGVIAVRAPGTDPVDEDDVALVQAIAAQVGAALRAALAYERLDGAYLGTAQALASALEAGDTYPPDHARLIAEQAAAVGAALGLDPAEVRDLRFAAVLHDIGKVAVPSAVLRKVGPLDDSDRTAIERHAVAGEALLAAVDALDDVRLIIRHEHERFDGHGYPDGLAGDQIPLGSRILLVCDALQAMTSERPYRRALTFEDAVAELRRQAGGQFDPAVVEALLAVLAGSASAAAAS